MRIYDNRPSFYQWDTDQKVVHDFQVGDEVHFFNPLQEVALTVKAYQLGDDIVADVPNVLLQSSYPITVYWMHVCSNCKCTKEKFTFKVDPRPKPTAYVYTETEILSYSSLDERITKLEKYGVGGGGGSGEGVSPSVIEEIVNDALKQAKNSGEFNGRDGEDGEDGYTPVKGVDYFDGKDGTDYILTEADKEDIASMVIQQLPIYKGEVESV